LPGKEVMMAVDVQKFVSDYQSRIKDKNIYFYPDIPPKKLNNVFNSYALEARNENILILIDNTTFGNAKDGALFTDKKIYAKNIGASPQSYEYNMIKSVFFVEGMTSKLYINDIMFLETNFPEKYAMHLMTDMLREISKAFQPQGAGASFAGQQISDGVSQSEVSQPMAQKKENRAVDVQKIISDYRSRIKDKKIFFHPDIPPTKLNNAINAYAVAARDENILMLIDNTNFGGAKDGALLTDKKIYAKNIGSSGQSYEYNQIKSVFFVEGMTSKLHINDIMFLETNFPEKYAMHLVTDMLREISKAFAGQYGPEAVTQSEAAQPVPQEKEKPKKGGFFAPEKKGIQKGIVGGIAMMAIATVWFFVGYEAGYIFYYPPILFVIGLYAFLKGLITGNISGKKKD
jgi:hypothetical protein